MLHPWSGRGKRGNRIEPKLSKQIEKSKKKKINKWKDTLVLYQQTTRTVPQHHNITTISVVCHWAKTLHGSCIAQFSTLTFRSPLLPTFSGNQSIGFHLPRISEPVSFLSVVKTGSNGCQLPFKAPEIDKRRKEAISGLASLQLMRFPHQKNKEWPRRLFKADNKFEL